MITAKRRLRSLLLLLLLLSLLLTSCHSDDGQDPLAYPLGSDGAQSETAHTPFAEQLYVILPAKADEALAARAQDFTEALSLRTEIPATLLYDDGEIPADPEAAYVLLGNTAFSLSRLALSSLKRDDYLCRWDGESRALILGGKSDAATVAAIDRFCEELLPYADNTLLMSADCEFLVRAEYPIDTLTLNGHSLAHYTVAYPDEDTQRARAVALALREALADRCGFYPDLLPRSAVTATERLIAVGFCPAGEEAPKADAQILSHGTVISLLASSPYDLAAAAEALVEQLAPKDAPREVSLTLPAHTDVTVPSAEIRILSLPPITDPAPAVALPQIRDGAALLQQSGTLVGVLDATAASLFPHLTTCFADYTLLPSDMSDMEEAFGAVLCYRADRLTRTGGNYEHTEGGILSSHFFTHENGLSFTLLQVCIDSDTLLPRLQTMIDQATTPTVLFCYLPASLSSDIPGESISLTNGRSLWIAYTDGGSHTEIGIAQDGAPLCTVTPQHPFLNT